MSNREDFLKSTGDHDLMQSLGLQTDTNIRRDWTSLGIIELDNSEIEVLASDLGSLFYRFEVTRTEDDYQTIQTHAIETGTLPFYALWPTIKTFAETGHKPRRSSMYNIQAI